MGKKNDDAEPSGASGGSTAWMVLRAWPFSAVTAAGFSLKPEPGGPTRFIPVFDTRAEAVEWCGSDDDSIQSIQIGSKQP